ncbi:hypothetical protein [Terribacillus halophilus]|uniref:hypothetical protein n=1 Tax=Terribacillus halophilus TaxID=361279 RepID=UPI003981FBDE
MDKLDRIAQLESFRYTKTDLAEMIVKLEEAEYKQKLAPETELAAKYEGVILINGKGPGRSRVIYDGKEIENIETVRLFIDPEYGTTLSVQHKDKVVAFLKGMPRRFNSSIHYRKLLDMDKSQRDKVLNGLTNKALRYLVKQMLSVIKELRGTVIKKSKQLESIYGSRKEKQL